MSEAVRQARLDADAMARAAGGSLGRLLSLASTGIAQPLYNVLDSYQLQGVVATGASRQITTIVPGELIVSAQVLGRWEFLPGTSR
jgi:uncharacterized protein YggE